MMARKTGARGLGKLFAEATREFKLHERHEMLNELLPQMTPLPREIALEMMKSAAADHAETQYTFMQHLYDAVPRSLRSEMVVELISTTEGGLDEAADALTNMLQLTLLEKGGMQGIEGASKAKRLVAKLVPAMSDTSRSAAIGAILGGLGAEQKATVIGDAFESLPSAPDGVSDVPSVLKELVENLASDDRKQVIRSLLRDIPSEERVVLLRGALDTSKPEEVTGALAGRAKNTNLLAAMPQDMLANILKELPMSIDGARLASILPDTPLQLWGSKLIGAAPEDACKVWLAQLLTAQCTASSSHASLSQLLVGALTPEVFAYAYANLGLDERLRMLTAVNELKKQGVVSPAPFSRQEVEHLSNLLGLAPAAESPASSTAGSPFGSPVSGSHLMHRRGSVAVGGGGFAAGPQWRRGSIGGFLNQRRGSVLGPLPGALSRIKEKAQIIPLEQTMRTIADIYQKKIKDDQLADMKMRMRCSMDKFVRNYLLRQYGMKSMAEKAVRELTATVRAYSSGGEQSVVRIRMFGDINGMLKNEHGLVVPPWSDRKTDFFLFVLVRLARATKEESSPQPESGSPPSIKSLASLAATERGRRGSARPLQFSPRNMNNAAVLWSTAPITGVKEILCREQVTISLSAVQSMVDVVILDRQVGEDVGQKMEKLAVDGPASPDGSTSPVVHFDDILEAMMGVWDEQEQEQTPRGDLHLRKIFKEHCDANGRMSFADFEKFCTSLVNVTLEEDRILDLFDEAIHESACPFPSPHLPSDPALASQHIDVAALPPSRARSRGGDWRGDRHDLT